MRILSEHGYSLEHESIFEIHETTLKTLRNILKLLEDLKTMKRPHITSVSSLRIHRNKISGLQLSLFHTRMTSLSKKAFRHNIETFLKKSDLCCRKMVIKVHREGL
ncbi:MAG: hypothetical protein ABEJ93_03465 [Candidatus Nanohalobium sp.]